MCTSSASSRTTVIAIAAGDKPYLACEEHAAATAKTVAESSAPQPADTVAPSTMKAGQEEVSSSVPVCLFSILQTKPVVSVAIGVLNLGLVAVTCIVLHFWFFSKCIFEIIF